MSALDDDHTLTGRLRTVGWLGPVSSCFTLAWLATHRDRLHTFVLGGKRLSVLVIWDERGEELANRSEADVDAVRQIVRGDKDAR